MFVSPRCAALAALAIGAALFGFPAGSAAFDPAEVRRIVDAAVRPLMAEHDVPGMAVAVTVAGQPAFASYGVASRESKTLVSEDTLFEIGSVSKTFTATLACYAKALGKLSLRDAVGKHMPELEASAIGKASLLDLGAYTAGGLPLQFPAEVSDRKRMIGYFRRWKPDAEPGALRRYSNPSIGLLGHVTGLALGSPFADAVGTLLFPRLGLKRSYVRVPDAAMASYAWGYGGANRPIRARPGMLDAEAYGVKSTAADMIRFVQANIEPSRLESPIRRAVEGTQLAHFQVGEMAQGLGWEQYPYPVALERLLAGNSRAIIMEANAATPIVPPQAPAGPTLFNKTGSTNGFGAYVAFVPDRKIGVVMLANRNIPIPARIKAAHAILEQLSPMAR